MKYIVIFVFLLGVFSCSNSKNNNIIDEKKFINILVDIHMADATIVVKGLRIKSDSAQIRLLYNDIFSKYNITQKQIDNTFTYYSKKPLLLDRLYSKVSEKIIKKEDNYKKNN